MNEVFLPKPKKIRIENFSLYSNNLKFEYEFKDGLNLIVGGNGIGKTTFVNLIIFGFIGLYTRHNEHQRTYKGEAKGYRKVRSTDYFLKRMMKDVEYNKHAKIILEFEINNILIKTTRNIYTSQLEKVNYYEKDVEYSLDGNLVYDTDYSKNSKIRNKECLNFNYEQLIERISNLPFDGIIFFINSILLFDERRDTIFDNVPVQNDLFSKYFQEKEKDKLRQNYKDKSTYHNSLSRQNSEKIKVINNILKQFDNNEKSNKLVELNNLKLQYNSVKETYTEYFEIKEKNFYEISQLKSEKSKLEKEINTLQQLEQNEQNEKLNQVFNTLHKNYNIFKSQIKDNCKCPMCNKELKKNIYTKISQFIENDICFLCESNITKEKYIPKDNYKSQIKNIAKKITNVTSLIVQKEKDLTYFEKNLLDAKNDLFELKKKISEEDYKVTNKSDELDGFDVMQKQIDELEKEKEKNKKKSLEFKQKLDEVEKEIEKNKIDNTIKLSTVFHEYAGAFTKLPCSLKYDDPKDGEGKRFIPTINGIDRLYADELSESQRFFIDHSFRMAILEAFRKSASFYICETPDSSLDISYEDNASKVFLRYLNDNNVLILTSNFNNSDFIENILSSVSNVGFINLLEIGNPSVVQKQNLKLKSLVKKVEDIINARK